ncbi:hypothetical protein GCM10009559_45310 [Pseudonocardia zijingensis]|jgi:hypothetical protein|uniref:Uncharacterized protein n=2 Tax=Pseudonocardia zijingensis TaxID=153376 RepID=A0ABN1QSC3_9PSEU
MWALHVFMKRVALAGGRELSPGLGREPRQLEVVASYPDVVITGEYLPLRRNAVWFDAPVALAACVLRLRRSIVMVHRLRGAAAGG